MKENSVFYVLICIIHFLYAQEIENIKVEKFRKEGLPLFYRLDYIPLKNRNITIEVLQMGLENSTESQCVNQKNKTANAKISLSTYTTFAS